MEVRIVLAGVATSLTLLLGCASTETETRTGAPEASMERYVGEYRYDEERTREEYDRAARAPERPNADGSVGAPGLIPDDPSSPAPEGPIRATLRADGTGEFVVEAFGAKQRHAGNWSVVGEKVMILGEDGPVMLDILNENELYVSVNRRKFVLSRQD